MMYALILLIGIAGFSFMLGRLTAQDPNKAVKNWVAENACYLCQEKYNIADDECDEFV